MSKQLRILHIPAYALHGGCEKNCYHFIKASENFLHKVIVLGTEGPMTPMWRSLGVDVQHLDVIGKGMLQFRRMLAETVKGSSWDLVICWSTIRLPLQLSAINGVTSNVKVYLGNPIGANYRAWKDVLLSKIFNVKLKVTLMACSRYVLHSYRASAFYSTFPTEVSLNPVEIPAVPREAPDDSKLITGMVARLDPIKDHSTVIKAFAEVVTNFPDVELHLVGDGAIRKQLEQICSDLGISRSVIFHGDVSDVYGHLRRWHLFLYATTPDEGLGSAVAEAMANGLPCVLSDLPMLRELADHNSAEWFPAFDYKGMASKIIILLRNSDRRDTIGRSAFSQAQKKFGGQRFVNDYVRNLI